MCAHDADLFLVAEDNGKILATLMGAFDGRRGMMYHLAVDKAYRHRGIAAELIDQFENKLREKGCIRYYLLVVNDNDEAIRYYQKKGYEQLPVKTFAKNLI
ncbi:MAG: GNAT family N-acetyltransferase [Chloroflexota bacterium]